MILDVIPLQVHTVCVRFFGYWDHKF